MKMLCVPKADHSCFWCGATAYADTLAAAIARLWPSTDDRSRENLDLASCCPVHAAPTCAHCRRFGSVPYDHAHR